MPISQNRVQHLDDIYPEHCRNETSKPYFKIFHIDPACFAIWGIPVCSVTLSRFDEVDVEKNITVLSHSGNDVCVGSREAFAEVDVVATHTAETTARKDLGQLGGVCPVHNVKIRTPLQLPQVWINALK